MPTVHLLDHVAGNIRSLVNAIERVGYQVEWVKSPEDVASAEVSRLRNRPLELKTNIRYRNSSFLVSDTLAIV